MRIPYRKILFPFLVLLAISGIAIIIVVRNKTPEKELNIARKMISEAEMLKASRYANEHYQQATQYFDSAMVQWKCENERFILFRSYGSIAELARKSAESSGNAISATRKNIIKVKTELEIRMTTLGERLKDFDDKYSHFPMKDSHREEIAKIKLQFSEGVLAFKNEDYAACGSKLDSVETTLDLKFLLYEEKFSSYLSDYPKWLAMVEKTLTFSRRNSAYCIVIDKLARECMLFKDGKLLHTYEVELGANWMGDKNQQGDKSTPEGLYKIIDKKSGGQSRYYKAFMLDYPNAEDQKRFKQNKEKGLIKADANIGNLIEIHGHGGKGTDWTDGCIALKDANMDVVFKLCPIGTWVTIVGSSKITDDLSINDHENKR